MASPPGHVQQTNRLKMEIPYNFFYWGPLLFKIKVSPKDLKKFASLCSKKDSSAQETLVGVIEHEHYVNSTKYDKIIEPYLDSFRHCYQHWYGQLLTKKITTATTWVNFMKAGEFNPPHIHTRCDFSSVLFTKIPSKLKEENKAFKGKGGGPGAITFIYGEFSVNNIHSHFFFPEEGDFFMFPASLNHFVAPFLSKGERISMSANFRLE